MSGYILAKGKDRTLPLGDSELESVSSILKLTENHLYRSYWMSNAKFWKLEKT